ncbi:MAG: sigma factor, partial [Planctomycetota bacterium]|nr:sigma factor [Planctomycetota bacterium]
MNARPQPPSVPSSAACPSAREAQERADVARALGGDRGEFERLAVRAMPQLLGAAQRILGERFAAEEAVADGIFRAWRAVGGFRA